MTIAADARSAEFRCPDGGRLRYQAAGDGVPVVLVHGFALDRTMWQPQWPALRQRCRAIRYDLRGYGESSLPDGPYSHVDDLLALLEHLRAGPAHVVGLSMGGRVALQLALDRPSAVRSLTLVDSVLDGFRMSDAWGQHWRRIVAVAEAGDVAQARQLWLEHELFAAARSRADVAPALEAMVARYSGWHWSHADPGCLPARLAGDVLASVSVPTLVVVGDLDLPDFQAIARRVVAEVPRATLKVIAGAGHLANLEAADEFNETLLGHLGAA